MQIDFNINDSSEIPKYQQLVDLVKKAIANNSIGIGDALPSVNQVCNDYNLSRDTVFKSYNILKEECVIESVPNKGYYVANAIKKVLLVLDTFEAYKEVLYHSFIDDLPDNIDADVQFHHFNIDSFKTIINNSKGKYYKYVVMNFNHADIPDTLSVIDNDRLLLIDWNIYSTDKNNFVFQDFGKAFYEALKKAEKPLRKYKKIVFLYPEYTNHPLETITYFNRFGEEFDFYYEVSTASREFKIKENVAYISVSDRLLGLFLEQCRTNNLEPGVNVGFLSYNETPMKKFIYKGISVISTDFHALGAKVAEFVSGNGKMQTYIPTTLILRESL